MSDTGIDSAVPFDLLGHEDRIGILEALVQQRAADPADPTLTFSELREQVGVEDSGRFNYHLEQLAGRFVSRTDDGYELSAAGRKVAGAILSGGFETDNEWGPVALEAPCRECGEPVAVSYEDGMIRAECDEGHLNHRDYFPSTIVERTSLPEAMELATVMGQQDLELLLREVCPNCHGSVRAQLELDDEAEQAVLELACGRCGHYLQGPPGLVVLPHPVLRTFYLERDRDVRTAPLWTLPFLMDPDRTTVETKAPLRVIIDASIDEDALTFEVDHECSVIEYDIERR